jgi:hypothetical protein
MWISNIYLWLLADDSIRFLDSSMKYITFGLGVSSAIIYMTLIRKKKRRERKEIEKLDIDIESSRLENKIKNQQLIELQKKNRE